MSPSGKAASAAEYACLTKELSLQELRKARELTQTSIAAELEIAQALFPMSPEQLTGNVEPICTRIFPGTLAYLHAVGAELEIRAVFPDGHAVKITQFAEELGLGPIE